VVPFVPIKHVFLEAALRLQPPTTEVGLFNHVPVGLQARPTAVRDARYAAKVERVLRQTLEAGERIRICDALTAAGCWSEFRHNRAGFPKVREAVERLRESAANVKPSRKKVSIP
jgi:hypothetical protein